MVARFNPRIIASYFLGLAASAQQALASRHTTQASIFETTPLHRFIASVPWPSRPNSSSVPHARPARHRTQAGDCTMGSSKDSCASESVRRRCRCSAGGRTWLEVAAVAGQLCPMFCPSRHLDCAPRTHCVAPRSVASCRHLVQHPGLLGDHGQWQHAGLVGRQRAPPPPRPPHSTGGAS